MGSLGRVQRAVLAALDERRAGDTRTLAMTVFETNPPTPGQRDAIRRAIRRLEARGLVATRRRVRYTVVKGTEVVPTPDGGTRKVRKGLTVGRTEMKAVTLAPACRECGRRIERKARGRPREFCGDACRSAAWHREWGRRRRAKGPS